MLNGVAILCIVMIGVELLGYVCMVYVFVCICM